MCEEVETIIFGSRHDPEKTHGRKKNKAKRTLGKDNDEDEDEDDSGNGSAIRTRHGGSSDSVEDSVDSSDDEGAASDVGSIASSTGTTGTSGGVPLPTSLSLIHISEPTRPY